MPAESVTAKAPPVLFTCTPVTEYNLVESYTVPEIVIWPMAKFTMQNDPINSAKKLSFKEK